ncbi:MAG: LicD family protein [Clostridia bacterium]|nr:LicD family protein [Clostridia bacterium]
MAEHNLSKIQQVEIDIMKSLLEIFEKYDIKYYMQGGTMLGAVRHQGFIPWDDDIDIGLPRPDYEKFLEICEKNLPKHLKLRTYWDDSYHHFYFSRVVDTRYHIKREGGIEERLEEVWVDIFPLDGLPRNAIVRCVHKGRLLFNRFVYSLSTFDKLNIQRPNRPLYHRIIIKFLVVTHIGELFTSLNSKKLLDKIDKILKSCPVEKSDVLVNFMGDNHFVGYTKECYGYGVEVPYEFEDIELVGLKDYDFYLKVLYNDYMQLPPEEKRNYHMAELLEE